jgi:predicted CoA-binding protein
MTSKQGDSELRQILQNTKRIAVIGLSPVPARPSFGVTRYLISQGYEIYGVRPASPPQILNRPCVESLASLKVDIDMINVFRNPDALPDLIEELRVFMESKQEDARPRYLWLQEGVIHADSEEKARKLGLKVVSDLCILKEHARLL